MTGKIREIKPHQIVSFEIDPAGTMPWGEAFTDYFDLRDKIASKHDDFTRGFVEDLIAYGLGRPYGFTDEPLANAIMEQARSNGYTIQSMVHALIQSAAFQNK